MQRNPTQPSYASELERALVDMAAYKAEFLAALLRPRFAPHVRLHDGLDLQVGLGLPSVRRG